MKSVWKYKLGLGQNTLTLPYGAKVLKAGIQSGIIYAWVLIPNTEQTNYTSERKFLIVGTGHPIDVEIKEHIATFFMDSGTFVWHLFEVE